MRPIDLLLLLLIWCSDQGEGCNNNYKRGWVYHWAVRYKTKQRKKKKTSIERRRRRVVESAGSSRYWWCLSPTPPLPPPLLFFFPSFFLFVFVLHSSSGWWWWGWRRRRRRRWRGEKRFCCCAPRRWNGPAPSAIEPSEKGASFGVCIPPSSSFNQSSNGQPRGDTPSKEQQVEEEEEESSASTRIDSGALCKLGNLTLFSPVSFSHSSPLQKRERERERERERDREDFLLPCRSSSFIPSSLPQCLGGILIFSLSFPLSLSLYFMGHDLLQC